MRKKYYFFKLIYALSRITKNANNTDGALTIADCLYKLGLLDTEMKTVLADAKSTADVKKRRVLVTRDYQRLSQLPEGTLGNAYAKHMITNNLQPDFFEKFPVVDDHTYIMMRLRETHDLWHVMTGFGTSVPHELGLQAFMFGQIFTPLGPILICARCLISSFRNPAEVAEIFDQVSKGWKMARNAKLIFGVDWEDSWHIQLNDLRAQYDVVA